MAQGDKEKQFRSSASIYTKLKLGVVIFNPRWEYLMNQNPQISTEKKGRGFAGSISVSIYCILDTWNIA